MSSRLLPFGSDTIAVPAYFARGDGPDDPDLARWKQEHPDWFVAGTWTAPPRRRPATPPVPGNGRPDPSPAAIADLAAAPLLLLDPATASVADFRRIADEARGARQPGEPNHTPSTPEQRPAHSFPPASDLAYPDIPPPGSIPNVRATSGYIFRLPNGEFVPDDSRTSPERGYKRLSPTGFVMTPYPDSAPEVAAAGRRAGQALSRSATDYNPDMPPLANMSQDAVNFTALMGMAVGQGGIYDYQREGSHLLGFDQHPQFRAISNFNVGLFCQQAGLSLDETLRTAGSFAALAPKNASRDLPYGLDEYTAEFIKKGWHTGESATYGQATPSSN